MKIHREGYRFIFLFAAVTALLTVVWNPLFWPGLVLTIWCAAFFRDPERTAPEGKGLIIAPADGKIWRLLGGGSKEAVVDGQSLNVRYARMVSGNKKRVAWYWYWVDGRYTSDPRVAKLLQAKSVLFGGTAAAAAIVVSTEYRDSPEEAEKVLSDYLGNLAPLGPLLGQAAGN